MIRSISIEAQPAASTASRKHSQPQAQPAEQVHAFAPCLPPCPIPPGGVWEIYGIFEGWHSPGWWATLEFLDPGDSYYMNHSGVCELNTHLDGDCVFNVWAPLPLLQSWRKDTQQQLTKVNVYFTDAGIVENLGMQIGSARLAPFR